MYGIFRGVKDYCSIPGSSVICTTIPQCFFEAVHVLLVINYSYSGMSKERYVWSRLLQHLQCLKNCCNILRITHTSPCRVQVLLLTHRFHYGMSKECLMDASMHMHMHRPQQIAAFRTSTYDFIMIQLIRSCVTLQDVKEN